MSGLLATLAAEVIGKVIAELPGKLPRLIQEDPEKIGALEKAFQAGLEAALKAMNPSDSHRAERYAGILKYFLGQQKTVEELAKLIDLRNITADPEAVVKIADLESLFKSAYRQHGEPGAYEGLNFPQAMRAFVQAYADAVKRQSDRLPWINTAYLDAMLRQLGVLPAMADDIRAIKDQLPPRPAPSALRENYLWAIARESNELPWSAYDPRYASPTERPRLTLQDVYVPLEVILSPSAGEKDLRKRMEPGSLAAIQ